MAANAPSCPADALFDSFLSDEASDDDRRDFESHLNDCESCQVRLEKRLSSAEWRRLLPKDPGTPISIVRKESDGKAESEQPIVDGYTIEAVIGHGGMGTVYRAHQHSLNRTVALKILSSTATENPRRWLRFKTEVEAIGRLQHPNIVRVFDAGEYKERAYVAQELCDSESLESQMGTPRPPADVVSLLQQLVDAIDHAHRQEVLHRDIKPSNILFAGGRVKLADFGLAKLTDMDDSLTRTRDVMGSPSYMAPEQARADHEAIGPETDIFQTGILMYELLTGIAPFRADSAVETLRLAQEHEPVSPRRLQPSIPRDLQTICQKCLSKRPSDRYRTAAALAEDLQRFQDGRPIHARPPGILVRSWKWTRRRPAAAALIGVTILAIASLLLMWANFTSELAEQTRIAEGKTQEAQRNLEDQIEANAATLEVLGFFTVDLLDAANPENDGANVKVIDVIDRASVDVEERFGDRPRVEAIVQAAIGNVYLELGQPLKALPHMERGVKLFQDVNEPLNQQSYVASYQLALCFKGLGRYEDALKIADRLTPLAAELGIEQELELRFFRSGQVLRDAKPAAMIEHLQQLHSDCVQHLGANNRLTLSVLGNLTVAYLKSGDLKKAEEHERQRLAETEEILGPDDPDTVISLNNLAIILVRQGRFEESEKLQREVLERKTRSLGEKHFGTIGQKHNLAMVIWRQGRHQEATDLLQEVIVQRGEVYGPSDPRPLETTYQAGRMYLVMEEYERGEELFDRVLGPLVADRPATGQWASLLTVWAEFKIRQKKLPRARTLLDSAHAVFETAPDEKNASRLKALATAEDLLKQQDADATSSD